MVNLKKIAVRKVLLSCEVGYRVRQIGTEQIVLDHLDYAEVLLAFEIAQVTCRIDILKRIEHGVFRADD